MNFKVKLQYLEQQHKSAVRDVMARIVIKDTIDSGEFQAILGYCIPQFFTARELSDDIGMPIGLVNGWIDGTASPHRRLKRDVIVYCMKKIKPLI